MPDLQLKDMKKEGGAKLDYELGDGISCKRLC